MSATLPGTGPGTRLDAALEQVAATDRLLVASDFDGVLAPFVLDPMDAVPQAGTIEDLRALAALPATAAAVVSGRDLDTLTGLTGLGDGDGITRIGSHGAQSSRAAGLALTDDEAATLARLTTWLEEQTGRRAPGTRLEHKPAAVVVHWRGLDEPRAATVRGIAAEAAETLDVRLLAGKGVDELTVVHADKGTALRALADELDVAAIVYLGDDVTDEHAFAVLGPGDVGIKVGEGETAASHRVDAAEDVPGVLRRLRELRAARG